MKNFKLTFSSFVLAAFMVIGVQNAAAQKACFNTKTTRQVINNETVAFTCNMQELQSKDAANAVAAKMRSTKGVKSVEIKNFSVNKADFVITMPKKQGVAIVQNSLLAAGIQTVFIDNKPVATAQLTEVVKGMQKKK